MPGGVEKQIKARAYQGWACALWEMEGGSSSSLLERGEKENHPYFSLGQMFDSFESLQAQLRKYESEKYVKFWCRDSRTIQAAPKKINGPLCEKLKYYEVCYACVHGGKKFSSKSSGKRVSS